LIEEKNYPIDNDFLTSILDVLSTGVYTYATQSLVVNGTSLTQYQQFIRSEIIKNALHTGIGFCSKNDMQNYLAWGRNELGQLGDGTTTDVAAPEALSNTGLFNGVEVIAKNSLSALALTTGGDLISWGSNFHGNLGDGTVTDRSSPVSVSTGNTFVAIAAGGDHMAAIDYSGFAWAWGDNSLGQVGDGTVTNRSTPTSVVGGNQFVALSAGGAHCVGLDTSNQAWAWGDNTFGELGNGTTDNSSSPVVVLGGLQFTRVVCSNGEFDIPAAVNSIGSYPIFNVALDQSGFAWTWGAGGNGQLGNGATNNQSSPVSVAGGARFVDIACGAFHALALDRYGALWAWGANGGGQLGDGTTANRSSPVSVATSKRFVQLAAKSNASIAIDTEGQAWAWGSADGSGELGTGGSSDTYSSPTSVIAGAVFRTRKIY
jgi:alpha-tubulin suppressor-like RCC1 family protein